MKKYLSFIGIIILIGLTLWLGYGAFSAYWGGHLYYAGILGDKNNWFILLAAIVAICLPLGYFFISSKISTKGLALRLGIGASIFGLIQSNIKGEIFGYGGLVIVFHTLLLFTLGMYLILGFTALGSRIQRKIIKFEQQRRQEILLSFGLGLCSFIIIVEILLGTGLLYSYVSLALLLSLGLIVRYERETLSKRGDIISDIFSNLKRGVESGKTGYIVLFILLIISLIYYYYGLQNSFVPYSTAWDANHEYMYIPKILAENHGIYRGNTVGNTMPGFWHQFIAFIFSIAGNGWFGLSPDNVAISMNNLSAGFVLVFGIAVIFQIFNLLSKKKDTEIVEEKKGKSHIIEINDLENGAGIAIGWSLLLLWLTSGMGAFLVIVDNKTDLGVMAFSLLALLAGLVFLQNKQNKIDKKQLLKYIIIAGLLFGIASVAKITAFVDLTIFGLLLIALRFSPITSLGFGIFIMGLVRKFNVLTAATILSESQGTQLMIIGAIIAVIGLCIYFISKNSNKKNFKENFIQLLILGISFIVPILILKLSWTSLSLINNDSYSFTSSLKSTFLVKDSNEHKDSHKLLAQVSEISSIQGASTAQVATSTLNLEEQNTIDAIALNRAEKQFEQCKLLSYDEDELKDNLQEVLGDGGSEDFGRYIGYGWNEFSKGNGDKRYDKNMFFNILALLWPGNKDGSFVCYSTNHDAKVLCDNYKVIDEFKINDLRAIYENGLQNQESEAGLLLKNAIDAYDTAKSQGKINFMTDLGGLFHDEIVSMKQYYQSHNIASYYNKDSHSGSIYIPYRLLIPLNISFNWSLQNLSSYYTDLGFFWVIIYLLLLISLPYALIKKDNILTSLSLVTLLGRGIRWIIGSAILWYGTVLISWSMITLAVFLARLVQKDSHNNGTKIVIWLFITLLAIIFSLQLVLNFSRIASQGANSVFVWYKGNIGKVNEYDDNLQVVFNKTKSYKWKDVFNLQFPQYNPIINALAERKNEDGVIVAGTYIQYFLGNQRNIQADGMLTNFWVNASDGDLCKTYWRLRNDNVRYFIIDPNIGTVTMGEGNESLFYRFFAKLTPNEKGIDTDGTITTLVRLANAGYLKLLSTNNIGAKYAFTLDDATMRRFFGQGLSDDELILIRSKMAVLQYFSDANDIFSTILKIFNDRITHDMELGIEDIANIYGMEVNSKNIAIAANNIMRGNIDISSLSQDERVILTSFLQIYSNPNADIRSLLASSISGGSQIIALELN